MRSCQSYIGIEALVEDGAVLLGLTLRSKEIGFGMFLNLLDYKGETLWYDKGKIIVCNRQDTGHIHCQSMLDEVINPCLHMIVGALEVPDWQGSN